MHSTSKAGICEFLNMIALESLMEDPHKSPEIPTYPQGALFLKCFREKDA